MEIAFTFSTAEVACLRGGTERVMAYLAALFAKNQHHITFFSDKPFDPSKTYPFPAGTAYVLLPSKKKERAKVLAKELKRRKIDLWYTHQSIFAVTDIRTVYKCGIPILAHVHNSLAQQYDTLGKEIFPLYYRKLKYVSQLIVLSQFDRWLLKRIGLPTRYMPNPLPFPLPSKSESVRTGSCPPRILWIGRFSPEKRPEAPLPILKRVLSSHPEVKLDYICGRDEQERIKVKRMVDESGIGSSVEYSPFVEDVSRHYRAAGILLVTSRYEGFMLVAYEAMAYGIPVVTYALPCVTYFKGCEGVLQVPQGDEQAAATAICAILNDPIRYRRMSEANYEQARQLSSIDFQSIYEGIFRQVTTFPKRLHPRICQWQSLASIIGPYRQQVSYRERYCTYVRKNGGAFRQVGGHRPYVADPFLFAQAGKVHLFYETLNRQGKGVIGCLREENGDWQDLGIVLETSIHLSYPQVFEENGHIYMIPESCDYKNGYRHGEVALYEAMDFPRRWEKITTLIPEALSDTTLLRQGGRYYLTGIRYWQRCGAELWQADALLGPWTRHPQSGNVNPSRRLRRCGGAFQTMDGRLYRIAQDCNGAYGKRVFRMPVLKISTAEYSEGPAELMFDGFRHTYNSLTTNGTRYETIDQRFVNYRWFSFSGMRILAKIFRKMLFGINFRRNGWYVELLGIKLIGGSPRPRPAWLTIHGKLR